MVGLINNLYVNCSPTKERHLVHDILGTDLYIEAKTIVQGKIDTSDNLLEKLDEIAR